MEEDMNTDNNNLDIKRVTGEIEALLRKHDLTGCVVLAAKTGEMEYLLLLDASWTAIARESETKMRLMQDFASPEIGRMKIGETLGMIIGVEAMLDATCLLLDNILESISEAFNIQIRKNRTEESDSEN
jgi:hypothetical protein